MPLHLEPAAHSLHAARVCASPRGATPPPASAPHDEHALRVRARGDEARRELHLHVARVDEADAEEGLSEAAPGPAIADADRANGHIGGGFVSSRVEINQFLGDDAAALARSSRGT